MGSGEREREGTAAGCCDRAAFAAAEAAVAAAMASNFWQSTHCRRWILPRVDIPRGRGALAATTMWMVQLSCKARMRQRVAATAIVMLRRFTAVANRDDEYDPQAVGVACLYLASKAEECTMQAKHWVGYAGALGFHLTLTDLLELEMHVLEGLECDLVVFHPYRPLLTLIDRARLGAVAQDAWSLCNDSYHTDVCLLYPPYVTAVAALYVACVINNVDMRPIFADLQVNTDEVYEVGRILMDAYTKENERRSKEAATRRSSPAEGSAAARVQPSDSKVAPPHKRQKQHAAWERRPPAKQQSK